MITHPSERWAASRASAFLLARTTKVVDSPVLVFWAVIRYLLISFSCPSTREASVLVYRAWGYIASILMRAQYGNSYSIRQPRFSLRYTVPNLLIYRAANSNVSLPFYGLGVYIK